MRGHLYFPIAPGGRVTLGLSLRVPPMLLRAFANYGLDGRFAVERPTYSK